MARPDLVHASAGSTLIDVVRTLAVLTLLSLLSTPVFTNLPARPSPVPAIAR